MNVMSANGQFPSWHFKRGFLLDQEHLVFQVAKHFTTHTAEVRSATGTLSARINAPKRAASAALSSYAVVRSAPA